MNAQVSGSPYNPQSGNMRGFRTFDLQIRLFTNKRMNMLLIP